MELFSIRTLFFSSIISLFVYNIGIAVYRLYFSPIASFPGPKLAALTLWYEFYYDVFKKGQYTHVIRQMHERYGPIVRINPYELHINDPDYYDEVYPGNHRRTNKWPWATKMFGKSNSGLATEGHELHRTRRGALAHFFSKASVQRLEPVVQSVVDKLVGRLHQIKTSAAPVNLIDVFSSFTADVISEYSFAKPYGYLDHLDFAPHWHQTMMDISQNSHLLKQFGWLEPLMRRLPIWLVKIVTPQMMSLLFMQEFCHAGLVEVKLELAKGVDIPRQRTIFYDILTNDSLRPQEKETEYLMDESQIVIAAGTVTTAHILSVTSFHIIKNPHVLTKLQEELRTVRPDGQIQLPWHKLEQLPYLNAVVNEGLRIGYGVMHRLQRISPDVPLQFNEWTIPANTPVSMTGSLIHDNSSIFRNPRSFEPQRWLQSESRLQKYLVPFSRGTRQCLGMNLAYCEIYLTLAAIFAPDRFSLKLYETDITDVETPHDFFNPCYRLDSKGIRVTVQ